MKNLRDKIRNNQILDETKTIDVVGRVASPKWQWPCVKTGAGLMDSEDEILWRPRGTTKKKCGPT